ncbi:MAG: TetR/AcrR family transcriptional regulator [Actinomycetota bacterium]
MATQAERTAETRRRILDAARARFAGQGYETTTIAELLDDAGVSKGALYHHFDSKESIAETLFSETSRAAIIAASRHDGDDDDPLESLVASCLRWMDEAARPEVASVLFDLGPTALGWERSREIENAHSLRVLRASIGRAVDAGRFVPGRTELAARTINAVLAELALLAVHPGEVTATPDDVAALVRTTIHGLATAGT